MIEREEAERRTETLTNKLNELAGKLNLILKILKYELIFFSSNHVH